MTDTDHITIARSVSLPVELEARRPLEYRGERVLTTALAAKAFGASEKQLQDNYLNNADRFETGKHFHKVTGAALRGLKNQPDFIGLVAPQAPHLTLWTERGIARHAKMLETETAWAMFETLEDAYFRVKDAAPVPIAGPTPQGAREARLLHRHFLSVARMAGLDGQQSLIAANRAVKAQLGVDPLGIMGITHMIAPTNDVLFTPTVIGTRLGGVSARKVNTMLAGAGLQTEERDDAGRLEWRPTDAGRKVGGRMVDVERSNGTGAAMQLKWPLTVLDNLRERIGAN